MKITLTLDLPESKLPELLSICSPGVSFLQNAEKPSAPQPVPNENDLPATKPAPANTAEPDAPETPTVTKADVFSMALKCSKAGKQKELAAAFKSFGAKKLSEVPESDYPALMKMLCNMGV